VGVRVLRRIRNLLGRRRVVSVRWLRKTQVFFPGFEIGDWNWDWDCIYLGKGMDRGLELGWGIWHEVRDSDEGFLGALESSLRESWCFLGYLYITHSLSVVLYGCGWIDDYLIPD
jgi:hypothetical protein